MKINLKIKFALLIALLSCTVVRAQVVASFEVSAEAVCLGNTLQFTDASSSSVGSVDSWLWSFGDGTQSDEQNPTHLFGNNAGTLQVKLIVTSGVFSDSAVLNIEVYENPIAHAGRDTTVCEGSTVTLGETPSATGGDGVYTYYWAPITSSISNPSFELFESVTEILEVTDGNGCIGLDTVIITVDESLEVDAGADQLICANERVVIGGNPTANGGFEPYTYTWNNATNLNNASIANPEATPATTTVFEVLVTDARGCAKTDDVKVTVGALIVDTIITHVSEFGNADGAIELQVSGGVAPYEFLWNDGVETQNRNNLSAGTYTVAINDANNCSSNVIIEITAPEDPCESFKVSAGTDRFVCPGTGIAIGGNPTALGGVPPYTYSWTPSAGLDNNTKSNPTATPSSNQLYFIQASDVNGCSGIDSVLVVVSENAISVILDVQNVTTSSGSDGSIRAFVFGGDGDYSYQWNTGVEGDTGALITDLPAGNYCVTVMDGNGCFKSECADVLAPVDSCNDFRVVLGDDKFICTQSDPIFLANGSIASGGSRSYLYDWTPKDSLDCAHCPNPKANPTTTTTYKVQVTDDVSNCSATDSIVINVSPNTLVIDFDVVNVSSSGASDGEIVATISGGSGDYFLNWSNGENESTLSNLNAGVYCLTVQDGTCSVSACTTVSEPACDDFKINAGEDVLFCPSNEFVKLGGTQTKPTVEGGSGNYEISWLPNEFLNCDDCLTPFASPTYDITYTLIVRDQTDACEKSSTVKVLVSDLKADAGNDEVICDGGNTIIGGNPSATGGDEPYSYSWSPSGKLSRSTISNPSAYPETTTIFTLTVSDNNGCAVQDKVTVNVSSTLRVETGNASSEKFCEGDSILLGRNVAIIGGNPPYTYEWSPKDGIVCDTCSSTYAKPSISGNAYYLIVKDAIGCQGQNDVGIVVERAEGFNQVYFNQGFEDICEGASVALGNDLIINGGALPYQYDWTPIGTLNCSDCSNPTATPKVDVTYKVTVTDADNCSNGASKFINVTVLPTLDAGDIGEICVGDTALLSASSDGNILWSPVEFLACDTCLESKAYPEQTTVFSITATASENENCVTESEVTIFVDQNCVWPGDANDDGIVNNIDLLNVAIGYNTTGNVRPQSTIFWRQQFGYDWTNNFTDGLNLKHADCNGNGIIDSNDLTAIIENYNLIHQKMGAATEECFDAPPFYVDLPDSLQPGDTFVAPIILGEVDREAQDLYAIAFDIEFNPAHFNADQLAVTFDNSWLGDLTNKEIITLKRETDKPEGLLNLAQGRLDQQSIRNGRGSIGIIIGITNDDLGKQLDSIVMLSMNVTNVVGVTATGKSLEFCPRKDSSTVRLKSNSIHRPAEPIQWSLQPNPAVDRVEIITNQSSISRISVYNVYGQLIEAKAIESRSSTLPLDCSGWSAGSYVIEIETNDGRAETKSVVITR